MGAFFFVKESLAFCVVIESSCQGSPESAQVCAAFYGIDVICKRIHVLAVAVVVLHSNFYNGPINFLLQVDYISVNSFFSFVDLLYERL